MLTALQAAAVVAAIAFAVLATAGVYTLVKLARLISAAAVVVTDFRIRSDLLVGRATSAVDRAHEQLARTDAITANMDEVAANIAELTADVSVLSGTVRTLLGGPLGRLAAFSFGVRRAIALRRGGNDPQRPPRTQRPLVRGDPGPSGVRGCPPGNTASPRDNTAQPGAGGTPVDACREPAALAAARAAAPGPGGRGPAGQARTGRRGRAANRWRAPR